MTATNRPTLSSTELTATPAPTVTAPVQIDWMLRAQELLGDNWDATPQPIRELVAKQAETAAKAEADKKAAEAKLAARGTGKHLNPQYAGMTEAEMLAAVIKDAGVLTMTLTNAAGQTVYTGPLSWKSKKNENGNGWRVYCSAQDHDVMVGKVSSLLRVVLDADGADRPAK